jgi:YD repeat-containing protein
MRAIDLDDETAASANEIADVACDRNLAPKRNPELVIGERSPEQLLRWRRVNAHFGGAGSERGLTFGRKLFIAQLSLRCPGSGRAKSPSRRLCARPPPLTALRAWPGAERARPTKPGHFPGNGGERNERPPNARTFGVPLRVRATALLWLARAVIGLSCLLLPSSAPAASRSPAPWIAEASPVATTCPTRGRPERSEDGRLGGAGRAQAAGRARNGVGTPTYDPAAQRTLVENSLGFVTLYQLNDLGQVVSIVDANGGETKYEYEHITCQKTKETDPLGAETISVYDARGNLIKTLAPDGAELALEYNASNQITRAVDAIGGQWRWGYDQKGRLIGRANPLGESTQFRRVKRR